MDRQVFQEKFGLLGESDATRQVVSKIMQISDTDITVLLQGETGVGKDVTARAIHGTSSRSRKDLVIVNCGAIPEGIAPQLTITRSFRLRLLVPWMARKD